MTIRYCLNAPVDNRALNHLFAAAWPDHAPRDFQPVLARALAHACAFAGDDLVGFAYVAWDGGIHGFLLDPTVHREWQQCGIGRSLVALLAQRCRTHGLVWLHVDYEPHLDRFYRKCGFAPTYAGLLRLTE